ncbi:hypothetical protein BV25DRAFT_1842255 [Artomyces pyxidatus]|uniref:Uncharacterized protein n=1 Tax=Artomyces pyxidatus TaxID=48021 RepID=A0ACB8SKL3_9AGAM|nr:hypothetical protein BV25DRAFT_1842255 [Artomyces pyxidatus]
MSNEADSLNATAASDLAQSVHWTGQLETDLIDTRCSASNQEALSIAVVDGIAAARLHNASSEYFPPSKKRITTISRNPSSPPTQAVVATNTDSDLFVLDEETARSLQHDKGPPDPVPSTDGSDNSEDDDDELVDILNGGGGVYPSEEIIRGAEGHVILATRSVMAGLFAKLDSGVEPDAERLVSACADTFSDYTTATTATHAVRQIAQEYGYTSFKLRRPELNRMKTIVDRPGLEHVRWTFHELDAEGIVTISCPSPLHEEGIGSTVNIMVPSIASDPILRRAKISLKVAAPLQGDQTVAYN